MRIGTFISAVMAGALAVTGSGAFFVFVAAVDSCGIVCEPTMPKPVL